MKLMASFLGGQELSDSITTDSSVSVYYDRPDIISGCAS